MMPRLSPLRPAEVTGSIGAQPHRSSAVAATSQEAGRRRGLAHDLVVAVSLANLSFLRLWSVLLTGGPADGYLMGHPPRPVDFGAAAVNVLALAALYYCAGSLLGRHYPALSDAALLLLLALPLNALRGAIAARWPALANITPADSAWRAAAAALAAVVLATLGIPRLRRAVARSVVAAAALLSPMILAVAAQSAVRIWQYDPAAYADRPPAPPLHGASPARRAVWLIFDELDERLAFAARHPGVRLPEFDALRAQSLVATAADSPAGETLDSMPALITGRALASARTACPADLLLRFPDGGSASWRTLDNVFAQTRRAGLETAITGWYHPYCRVLNDSLTHCSWEPYPNFYNSAGEAFTEILVNHARSLVETSGLSPFGQTVEMRRQIRAFRAIRRSAIRYAADPQLGLVLAHFPVPHAPYIYDADTGRLDNRNSPVEGYLDALELADRSLGEVRRALENAGVWDRTTVLVSADHGYRGSAFGQPTARWVPFVLKLAGRTEALRYTSRVETVASAGLLRSVLEGRVTTVAEAASWLDRSAARSRITKPE